MKPQIQCNGCDGGHCTTTTGEIRKLPYGNDGGNLLLCFSCFMVETKQRREANIEQCRPDEFEGVPIWEALEVYAPMKDLSQFNDLSTVDCPSCGMSSQTMTPNQLLLMNAVKAIICKQRGEPKSLNEVIEYARNLVVGMEIQASGAGITPFLRRQLELVGAPLPTVRPAKRGPGRWD